jgi:predicted transposase/invertase (TIGR01784 family)
MSFDDAIRKAVVECINQNVLKEFLENHKREVISMLTQEWDWGKALEVTKKEAWEDGEESGVKKGKMAVARNLRAKGMGVDDVADATGLTVDDILRL